jgi:nitroimidazol reductase NimA-like FMN-containing flavoprotein (pyridoxamine 5'-phosphate oxidase superfamily)
LRRCDKEITSREEIDAIIRAAQVCRIAFADGNVPYVVPVSFGYDGAALYFHTAKTGRKLEFIAANNRVCFELEANVSIHRDESDPCAWTFAFESVIGYGRMTELESTDAKLQGLNQIMLHYSGREWEIDDAEISRTRVWLINIESLTGKRSSEKQGATTS